MLRSVGSPAPKPQPPKPGGLFTRNVGDLVNSTAKRAVGSDNVVYRPERSGMFAPAGPSPIRQRPLIRPTRGVPRVGVYRGEERSVQPFLTGLSNIIAPLANVELSNITSNYGPRVHPVHGGRSNHTGIDLNGETGQPVYAPANAVLERLLANDSVYGNQILLGHGNEQETMYGHLNAFAPGLRPGSKIKAGQLIGYVGSTGLSTGSHLHWETWQNGQPVNPMSFLGGN